MSFLFCIILFYRIFLPLYFPLSEFVNPYGKILVNGKLNSYLADIDERATTMMFRLIEQMADKEGITEQLKAADQMAWVGAMNNIRNGATEIVNAELIYL